MPTPDLAVASRMAAQIQHWEAEGDQRAVFLSCYLLMTSNIISEIDHQEFHNFGLGQPTDGALRRILFFGS